MVSFLVRLACSTTCFPQDTLDIAIAKAAWAGFRVVEFALPAEIPIRPDFVRDRLRAEEVELAAIHAGAVTIGDAANADLTRIGKAAVLARGLDCGIVVARIAGDADLVHTADALRLLDRALGDIAIDMCVANGLDTALPDPDALRQLWGLGLPPRIGLALDPGAALLAGWDPSELSLLPVPPRHVYLNDADRGTTVPPGEGRLDPERFAGALLRAGYEGAVSLVLENAEPWAVEPTTRALHNEMRAWFGVSD